MSNSSLSARTRIRGIYATLPVKIGMLIIFLSTCAVMGNIIDRVDPETFSYDERLQYRVTYLGIRIGTIEILNRQKGIDPYDIDETVISMRTFSGVPFLSVHTEFYSRRGNDGYFIESTTFDRQRNAWAYYHAGRKDGGTEIIVDRGYKNMETGETYDVEIDTLHPGQPVHDALTFISILRDSAHTGRSYELDILIDRSIERIKIDPPEGKEKIEVRAFDNETDAYHISGVIDFEAIHGLSRKYQSSISADKRRIPLYAQVRIAIGSIKIELEEYERVN